MSLAAGVLPPLGQVEAALRRTTEELAAQLGRPQAQVPDWSEFEWRVARAVAALHGISPVLCSHLRWPGPAGWQQFLEGQRLHTVARAARLQSSLQLIGTHALAERVGFVALKGVALYEFGVYAPGERPMADLDLLVREADTPAIMRVLGAAGFAPSHASWKEQVFAPLDAGNAGAFGEHADNPIKVDLHTRISERLPRQLVDISPLIMPGTLHDGLNHYTGRAALMTHLLLHAAGEMVFRTLRLIQLHDIGCLAARLSTDDWSQVLRQRAAPWGLWWALPPLTLVARYYPSVPAPVLAAVQEASPPALRHLAQARVVSDVSFSNMRRSALPGIDWTRSWAETLSYAAERAFLTARTLLRRSRARALTGSAAAGAAAESPARWHRLRPVRPATLKALRGALAGP